MDSRKYQCMATPYTWTNNREGGDQIYEKLDRTYSDEKWRLNFPEAKLVNYPILLFDYSPIMLDVMPTKIN